MGRPREHDERIPVDEAERLLWLAEEGEPYEVDDVRLAYRHQSKRHHPDVGGDPDLFRRITEARDLLLTTIESSP